ncbi:MAG: leucine-rich repeat protein, partial [Clostridia bacterium]|nr:leucine-rich repeat protein [Clostridia bacterium]
MRNGREKSVFSFVICSVIMAIITLAANVFAHFNQGVAYAAEAVTYTSMDGIYTVTDDGVLVAYNGTEDMVTIPSEVSIDIGGDGVSDRDVTITTIGAGAFSGNDTIMLISLPETVSTIESSTNSAGGAFSGCTALYSVLSINLALEYIGDYAFYGCEKFNTIHGGDVVMDMTRLRHIGISAFEGCDIATNVALKSIQTIGYGAFNNCGSMRILQVAKGLTGIKYYSHNYVTPVDIETVENVESGIVECFTNKTIYTNNESVLRYLDNIAYTNIERVKVNITGPDCVQVGDEFVLNFSYQGNFTSKKLYKNETLLTDALESNYTDTINSEGYCKYKVVVTDALGDDLEYVYNVLALETDTFKDFTVKDGVLIKYNGTDAVVNVPEYIDETYEYGHITTIGKGAFSGNTTVTSVTLADSIDIIEGADYVNEGAFAGCTELEQVISENNALEYVGAFAFADCNSLVKLQTNALVEIGTNAFMNAANLTTIGSVDNKSSLESVEVMGANALLGTAIQGKIRLNSIKSIGEYALVVSGVEYIYIPKSNDIKYVSSEYPDGVAIESVTSGMIAYTNKVYTNNAKVITFLNAIGHSYIETGATFDVEEDIVVLGEEITVTNIVTTGDIAEYKWYVNGSEAAIVDNKITLTTLGNNVITLKVVDVFGNEVQASNSCTVKVFANDNYRYFTVVEGVLTAYTGVETNVVVPNYLDENLGYGRITTIGYTAFTGKSVVKVTLSNGITTIQDGVNTNGAFSDCYNLVEV